MNEQLELEYEKNIEKFMRNGHSLLQNISKSAIIPVSKCDGACYLIHFGFCDVTGADHGLQCQPHAELESQREGGHLVCIVQL